MIYCMDVPDVYTVMTGDNGRGCKNNKIAPRRDKVNAFNLPYVLSEYDRILMMVIT